MTRQAPWLRVFVEGVVIERVDPQNPHSDPFRGF